MRPYGAVSRERRVACREVLLECVDFVSQLRSDAIDDPRKGVERLVNTQRSLVEMAPDYAQQPSSAQTMDDCFHPVLDVTNVTEHKPSLKYNFEEERIELRTLHER